MLNLKNDNLRKRFDSIKYDLKKVEEVVYDLSIRGLIKVGPQFGMYRISKLAEYLITRYLVLVQGWILNLISGLRLDNPTFI